jgi:beta-lactamase regulating signal transducer with metallopeptidase domain
VPAAPFSVGLLHPVIVVPGGLLGEGARGDLEHVLLHECAHVRRRDALAAAAAFLAKAVFWFNPFAWIAARRLAALREVGCDAAVARLLGGAAPGYARTLARFASGVGRAPVRCAVGFLRGEAQVVVRLERLVRPSRVRPAVERAAALALLVGLLAVPPRFEARTPAPPAPDAACAPPGCFQLRFEVMRAYAQTVVAVDR